MFEAEKGSWKHFKALQLVNSGCVKRHFFTPSGREIWTVIGSSGDLLVDDAQPYCECMHFHYRVMAAKDAECVHLLALKIAKQSQSYRETRLEDEEYGQLLRFLMRDFSGL